MNITSWSSIDFYTILHCVLRWDTFIVRCTIVRRDCSHYCLAVLFSFWYASRRLTKITALIHCLRLSCWSVFCWYLSFGSITRLRTVQSEHEKYRLNWYSSHYFQISVSVMSSKAMSNVDLPPKKRYLGDKSGHVKEEMTGDLSTKYRMICGVIRHTSSPDHAIAYFQDRKTSRCWLQSTPKPTWTSSHADITGVRFRQVSPECCPQ